VLFLQVEGDDLRLLYFGIGVLALFPSAWPSPWPRASGSTSSWFTQRRPAVNFRSWCQGDAETEPKIGW